MSRTGRTSGGEASGAPGAPVFYLEQYGTITYANPANPYTGSGAAANGAALRAACAAARAAGGGVVTTMFWGWLVVDWVDLHDINPAQAAGVVWCHCALSNFVLLGENLGLVSEVWSAALNGGVLPTQFAKMVTTYDQATGAIVKCGYKPGMRWDGNGGNQNATGLGFITAGGVAGGATYGDGTFVSNGMDLKGAFWAVEDGGGKTLGRNCRATGAVTNRGDATATTNGTNGLTAVSRDFRFHAPTVIGAAVTCTTPGIVPPGTTVIAVPAANQLTLSAATTGAPGNYRFHVATQVETWILRVAENGSFATCINNEVSGLDAFGVQQPTGTGISWRTHTGGRTGGNKCHDLLYGHGEGGNGVVGLTGSDIESWNNGTVQTNTAGATIVLGGGYAMEQSTDVHIGQLNSHDNIGAGLVLDGAAGTGIGMWFTSVRLDGNRQGVTVQAGAGAIQRCVVTGQISNNSDVGVNLNPGGAAALILDIATLLNIFGNNGAGAEFYFGDSTAVTSGAHQMNMVPGVYVKDTAGNVLNQAVPASGVAIANPLPCQGVLEVTAAGGGAVTAVEINGQTLTGLTVPAGTTVLLPAANAYAGTVKLTYAVAPTACKWLASAG